MTPILEYILFWVLVSVAAVVFAALFCGKGEPISPPDEKPWNN